MPLSQILQRPTSSSVGTDHQDVSPIINSQTSGNSKCVINLSPNGSTVSYKSVSNPTLQDQVTEKESEVMNLVTLHLPALKKDLLIGTISSDDYASRMDTIMEQVKHISSEITCMKTDLHDHSKDLIYLKDDKVRHDHAITSLKIDVANCSDLIKETADDSTFHAKTIKDIRQGQAQVQEDIHNLCKVVSTHELKISLNGAFHLKSLWDPHDVETWPLIKFSKEKNFHWSKFHDNLKESKLQGDGLLHLKHF